MPFSDVSDFLKLLDVWIQVGMGWKLSWTQVTCLSLTVFTCLSLTVFTCLSLTVFTEWLGD